MQNEQPSDVLPTPADDTTDDAPVATKSGPTKLTSDSVVTDGQEFSSTVAEENALIVESGEHTITDSTITKSDGDKSLSTTAVYGSNSAVLVNGGVLNIVDSSIATSGASSPAIYSAASVTATGTVMISSSSEGIAIVGNGSVSLNDVDLTSSDSSASADTGFYKNIFIKSAANPGEADVATFSSTDSTITTDKGDTILVYNNDAKISLTETDIINNDAESAFLRIIGSRTTLTFSRQIAEGGIILDGTSTLNLILNSYSAYMGAINAGNMAQSVSLTLDETSQLILAGDSYVSELKNADVKNMNIYGNGYKLYVAGEEVAVNGDEAPELLTPEEEEDIQEQVPADTYTSTDGATTTDYLPYIVGGAAILVIIIAIIVFILHDKKKKNAPADNIDIDTNVPIGERPDFSQFDDGPVPQGNTTNEPVQTPITPPAQPPVSQTPPNSTPTPPSSGPTPLVGQM